MIGIESIVTGAPLRYTQNYLTPDIKITSRLIKYAAMEEIMIFLTKIYTLMS